MSMPLVVPQYTWGKQYNVFSCVDIEAANYMQNYAVFWGVFVGLYYVIKCNHI